jgi:N-succinyldiaminopimelate aminotransferase
VWPLVANMVRLAGGVPVFVDTLGRTHDAAALVAALEAAATPRAVAVYVNTPNNPVGAVLDADVLAAVAGFARARRLWIWSDEVYADLQFSGAHVAMRRFAPERTVAIHSASKAFGMAGYRVGWLLGPPEIVREATKVSTYTYYCASYPGQVAALAALGGAGARWQASAREAYAAIGGEVAGRLGVPAPQGGTFLFLDVGAQIDALGGLPALLFRLASEGVLVAPGSSFGPYPRHLRLCFTAAAPEVTRRGVEALARVLRSVTGGG